MHRSAVVHLLRWVVVAFSCITTAADRDKLQAQVLQVARIQLTTANSKPTVLVDQLDGRAKWLEAACLWGLYDLNYGPVSNCTPSFRSQCGRVVLDAFISKQEASALVLSVQGAMQGLYHQGEPPALPAALPLLQLHRICTAAR